ncbi:MAG TPA: hypothetical protein VFI25_17060 [Planctomycetota bacterium]|jgi:hypothetical protein|nr:hypothetical protein [Planctomycetota bacterium]
MTETKDDQELRAILQVIAALSDLDSEARARVINYVFQRLGIASPAVLVETGASGATPPRGTEAAAPVTQPGRRHVDIRTFGQEKSPRSANERVAVVAYYLSELAPADERKAEISAADIIKYFKQADFPLPGASRMTLVNAKNAGYLDAGAERGTYKLNPVGHNLVAHSLPAASTTTRRTSGRGNRKRARKTKKPGSRR